MPQDRKTEIDRLNQKGKKEHLIVSTYFGISLVDIKK